MPPLNHSLLPLSLYHKAKSLRWDPREIDLSQDTRDWQRLSDRECDIILRLSSQFLGGEEAVAHDLAPLLTAVRRDGNVIRANIVYSNARSGIGLSDNVRDNRIDGNTARGNGEHGIFLYGGSRQNTLTNNIISNNAQYGIYVKSDGNVIDTGNAVTGHEIGVLVRTADAQAVLRPGNHIHDNDEDVNATEP